MLQNVSAVYSLLISILVVLMHSSVVFTCLEIFFVP